MREQTQFLANAFREYERRVRESGAVDEHLLRQRLVTEAAPEPLTDVLITVADWIADADGLFVADFDLLARIPGLTSLDIVATERVLGSGLHERLHSWLPGIQESQVTQVASHESPVASHESPVASHESQVASHKPQVASHEPQVASHESRVASQSRKSRVTSRKSRVTSRKSRVTSRKSRVTRRKPRVTSRKSRVTRREQPVASHGFSCPKVHHRTNRGGFIVIVKKS
jgi:hypothetical protein